MLDSQKSNFKKNCVQASKKMCLVLKRLSLSVSLSLSLFLSETFYEVTTGISNFR